ncbi:hypothetical protein STEG23_017770 [Scotinomys teguina]
MEMPSDPIWKDVHYTASSRVTEWREGSPTEAQSIALDLFCVKQGRHPGLARFPSLKAQHCSICGHGTVSLASHMILIVSLWKCVDFPKIYMQYERLSECIVQRERIINIMKAGLCDIHKSPGTAVTVTRAGTAVTVTRAGFKLYENSPKSKLLPYGAYHNAPMSHSDMVEDFDRLTGSRIPCSGLYGYTAAFESSF